MTKKIENNSRICGGASTSYSSSSSSESSLSRHSSFEAESSSGQKESSFAERSLASAITGTMPGIRQGFSRPDVPLASTKVQLDKQPGHKPGSSSGQIGSSNIGAESSSGQIGSSDIGAESSSGQIGSSDNGAESPSGQIGVNYFFKKETKTILFQFVDFFLQLHLINLMK